MRNLFIIFFILTASLFSAQEVQGIQQDNLFNESEKEQTELNDPVAKGGGRDDDNGCLECDDLPIDDYIPLLFVISVGLILYKSYNKASLKASGHNS